MIPLLLSLRHGLSPGAKEVGEVMWPSPPLFFATQLLRCHDLSLTVVPSSFPDFSSREVHFAGVTSASGHLRRFHPDQGPVREGALSSVTRVRSDGRVSRKR